MYGNQQIRQIIYIEDQSGYAIKTANTILCFFLFLLSIGVFGFGIWLSVWTAKFNYISVILNYDIYRAGYILFIISGALLMIVSFIGLCGSTQESACLLLIFIIVAMISLIMLCAVTGMGMAFYQNFNNSFSANLTYAIKIMYGNNLQISRNQDVTNAIDQIQIQFQCCGVSGTYNSTSWELYKSSTWIINQITINGPPYVPTSCCVLDSSSNIINSQYCQGSLSLNPVAPPISNTLSPNIYLNMQGCFTSMSQMVSYYSLAMFGLALPTAIYLFIILVISFFLLRYIEVAKKQKNDNKNIIVIDNKTIKSDKTNYSNKTPSTNKYDESPSIHTQNDSRKILK